MALTAPKIDGRDSEAILQEARTLAPVYTPEWNADEETGAGAALLRIFAKLLEGVVRRLNDAPLKHYIAFLEMIGVKLLPAVPARAPLTFFLSKGAKEAVPVPERSQAAAAATDGGDPVVFETERAILATPAKLLAVYSVVPAQDEIFEHLAALEASTASELFADDKNNLQEHILYLGHDDLFNIKSAVRIELGVKPSSTLLAQADPFNREPVATPVQNTSVAAARAKQINWQYCVGEKQELVDGAPVKSLDWRDFDDVSAEQGRTVLFKRGDNELKQVKVNAIKSRWIRYHVRRALQKKDALAALAFSELKLKSSPLGAEQSAGAPQSLAASAPQSLAAAALPNQERPRKEAPREEGDRQLPPTSHLEIRQLQRRYAKPLATCLAPVAVCCGS